MLRTVSLLGLLLFALGLGGCASYEVMTLPEREAGLYPFADTKGGVSAAIDDLSDPKRAKKYLGKELAEHGVLPIEVIVSNHGRRRVRVGPADVMMLRGRQVIDPVPLEKVSELVKDRALIVTGRTAEQVDLFLGDAALQEYVLAPGESVQGVVFYEAPEEPGLVTRFFRVLRPFPQPSLKVKVAVTDIEQQVRLRFGPFGVYR